MFFWRITKYNPKYRDSHGTYFKNEWTSFSDIGNKFEGNIITLEDYLKIENAYVAAIILFMECLCIENFLIVNLEKNMPPKNNSSLMRDTYSNLQNEQLITKKEIVIVAKLILRENLWCKFEANGMYVHFGYDYYMYIGSKKQCKDTISQIKKSGLFVEQYKSPYQD